MSISSTGTIQFNSLCLCWFLVAIGCLRIMGCELSDSRNGGGIDSHRHPLTLTKPPPTVIFVNFKPFAVLLWLFYTSFVHSARTGHPHSLGSCQHTWSFLSLNSLLRSSCHQSLESTVS